jgi:hypothetical protein
MSMVGLKARQSTEEQRIENLVAYIARLRLPVTHRRLTRRVGAIFERARRSGGAQHSTERSRLRPDQRAHNRGHSFRDQAKYHLLSSAPGETRLSSWLVSTRAFRPSAWRTGRARFTLNLT